MNKCINNEHFTKTRLLSHLMILFIRVLKSTLLNVVLFLLGFSCGYMYVSSAVHHHAYENRNYESIDRIKHFLTVQREFNSLIDKEIEKLEHKVSHDEFKACEKFPGTIIHGK